MTQQAVAPGSEKKRWMVFVDGENFTRRAEEVVGSLLIPGTHYHKNVFVWMPGVAPKAKFLTIRGGHDIMDRAERAYYFTAVQGDEVAVNAARDRVRGCGFAEEVFKKRDGKSKQVDIALASRMVAEAGHNHYDIAVLFAGDEDYVPAVEEVKRFGKSVYLTFFDDGRAGGLASELRRVSDVFFPLTEFFRSRWQAPAGSGLGTETLSTGTTQVVR